MPGTAAPDNNSTHRQETATRMERKGMIRTMKNL